MERKSYIHAASCYVVCITAISVNSAIAQEVEPGGLLITLGLAERLEVGRNLGLDVPEEGTGTIASTILSFGLSDETRTERFSLDATTALRFSNLPDQGSDVDFGDAILEFEYARDAANAGLNLSADYLRYDIGFQRSLLDFTNDDGVIELPRDFDDLTGTGIRNEYVLDAQIDFGRENLVAYNFAIGVNRIDYKDASNPDLFASDTIDGSAGIALNFSQRTTAFLDIFAEYYEDESEGQTERDTEEITFGVAHEISSRARLEASFGFIDIDERDLVEGDILVTGPVGNLDFQYDMPDGELTVDFAASRDTPGRLNTFTVGRRLEIPDGEFLANIGVARDSDGDTDFVGALGYEREFGSHEAFARINRGLGVTDNREYRVETVADLGVIFGITPISQLGLRATYALAAGTAEDPRIERFDLDVVYSRKLTRDWNLNTGINYRTRDEEGVGRADSPLVFISVGRDFFWRP